MLNTCSSEQRSLVIWFHEFLKLLVSHLLLFFIVGFWGNSIVWENSSVVFSANTGLVSLAGSSFLLGLGVLHIAALFSAYGWRWSSGSPSCRKSHMLAVAAEDSGLRIARTIWWGSWKKRFLGTWGVGSVYYTEKMKICSQILNLILINTLVCHLRWTFAQKLF